MDIQKHIKRGNAKICKDTLIFNMTSATDCISRALGLCQLENPNHCYALLAEKRFPDVLAYRRRQAAIWDCESLYPLCHAVQSLLNKHPDIKYFRFSESGDFRHQGDVDKLKTLARNFPQIVFYGYTARKDLSFAGLPKNLVVNGSGWRRGRMNRFNAVKELTGKNPVCSGDCRVCNLCKSAKGLTIENKMHGSVFNLRKGK